ncbi:methyltransferase family protein [Desulfovibrio ferrophilus]|uniref:Isoprenylcysteine carboxyl methyltransferase n=1 Tax=Desulfovibrio ferrophilus TaxID=241368 RepID=A0A2Z6AY88_9BACT|nr:methyltransferase [Desulfovibrio ferrophilus]BBD08150.1 uncharacterized protein DFE_1424 [Desulfovibrio ferrophilus]
MVIAWINFAVLLGSAVAILYLYEQSVSPAARERLTGESETYKRCGRLRWLVVIPMGLSVVCFALYRIFPLPVPLPEDFPWPWWVSLVLALLIMVPAGGIMMAGARAAGRETMTPQKDQSLFGGIYRWIRHPQFYEVFFWWGLALVLHSPFLFVFSFVYLPVWVMMVQAEERDLVLRHGDVYVNYYRRTGAIFPRRDRREP